MLSVAFSPDAKWHVVASAVSACQLRCSVLTGSSDNGVRLWVRPELSWPSRFDKPTSVVCLLLRENAGVAVLVAAGGGPTQPSPFRTGRRCAVCSCVVLAVSMVMLSLLLSAGRARTAARSCTPPCAPRTSTP